MSDVVICPGCAAVVDRDEHLLCPACHSDLTGVAQAPPAAPAAAAPAPRAEAAHAAAPEAALAAELGAALAAAPEAALAAAPGAALAAAPEAALAAEPEAAPAASWACASPGCERNPPLAASVAACPFCLEPRPAVTAAAREAEGRYELRDESGAVVVELAGPGPWRLGRGEADSRQLSGCMTVSRSHALLARRSYGLAVRDLGSSNHTFVGAVALAPGEERILEPGATLGLGKTVVLHVHAA